MKTKSVACLSAYVAIALFTFGHAYHSIAPAVSPHFEPNEPKIIGAIPCALIWPLYWSVKLQEVKS